MDFAKSVSFKSYGERTTFFALSALRRLKFQSDLLDGTALEALSLVVCTKGPIYKESADPTSTSSCCRPVLCARRTYFRPHPPLICFVLLEFLQINLWPIN